ncbi:MAG: 1-deoxy-D-xylulose-5-phosphate synthase [Chlamydiota bacterium]
MTLSRLPSLHSPEDLKKLSVDELPAVAEEIRQRIIEVVSQTGGHLSSNLGTVELSLALHYCFNSPKDKLIWDVSHQCYTHKILTGRNENLDTLRQYQGVCGFTSPKESPHDTFLTGHAGTAISSSLGIAAARELYNEDYHVIPVSGDGSLTCGLSLEALNNIPKDLRKFIIILNDNKMSISKNVGAISSILSRWLSNPKMSKFYHELETLLSKAPYGTTLAKQSKKVRESIQGLVSPANFFEEYGLSYLGPFDGHNIEQLVGVFESVRDSQWPVIIHTVTNKGQGMDEALKNPTAYHGAKPFCTKSGKFKKSSGGASFPSIFGNHMVKMAETDNDLMAVTPAMLAGSCLEKLNQKFPERCFDVGIAEGHAVTFAGGLAYKHKANVVVSIYSSFLQRAFDNLFHDVCLQELPVVFYVDRAGLSAADGATHHGIYDISFLNTMPNMVIAQPRDGHRLKELMSSAFSWQRPTAIRYPNLPTTDVELPLQDRPLGKGEVLIEGENILIIALGHMCETACKVQKKLYEEAGIKATVLDPIFVKPLDSDLLCDLLTTHQNIVTIEEHALSGGLGSIINNFLVSHGYNNIKALNFGIPDTFVEHGSQEELLAELGLTHKDIATNIMNNIPLDSGVYATTH